MANAMFSFYEFNSFGVEKNSDLRNKLVFESVDDGGNTTKQSPPRGSEGRGESAGGEHLYSVLYEDVLPEQESRLFKYEHQEQKQQSLLSYAIFNNLRIEMLSPPVQACQDEREKLGEMMQNGIESKKDKRYPVYFYSLELLKKYGNGVKRLKREGIVEPLNDAVPSQKVEAGQELSMQEIMQTAGARFIQSFSETVDVVSLLNNPFTLSSPCLSNDEEAKNVELAEFLLASAEKVGNEQFDSASRWLKHCEEFSSSTGNPVQRVVYYFAKALRERIDKKIGIITSKGLEKQQLFDFDDKMMTPKQLFDMDDAMMSPNPTILACQQKIPFCQISHFAGIQAIVENVIKAKRIHIVDLVIRNGLQWTVLMQALASQGECPLELLKITAVGTNSEKLIEDTGKRLTSFAETMNLPFSFKIVMVADLLDLKENLLELDDEETVAVYSAYLPRSLIALPDRLDSMMKVIRNIDPCIMVVMEVEANHNSPSFVHRFIDTLFYYSAYFDCLDATMDRNDPNRMITESMYFGEGIRNTVATEGDERKIRNVKLDVWRAFFARFGMEETDLSSSSLYQANLIIKKFPCASSYTLDSDGKSLIIGWKGTPLHSLSAWKFNR